MSFKPRRNRQTESLRKLTAENRLSVNDLVYPVFVQKSLSNPAEIPSMPGQFRYNPEQLLSKVEKCVDSGIENFLLFGIPEEKDEAASESFSPKGAVQQAIEKIRKNFPGVTVMTDVCVCSYTPHGHCGVMEGKNIEEQKTNEILARMALSHAEAGAHVVSPSAMMDNQVQAIREKLDDQGFRDTAIMAYAAKYFSAFYGPFRDAADSAPQFGDRASYQMNPANSREAIREMEIDKEEGADILMVKPALPYLDIIQLARQNFDLPIAAYNVSGTFSMIKAAAEKGWLNEEQTVMEMALSIKRAGAGIIITYYAPYIAELLNKYHQ